MAGKVTRTLAERFWSKVDKSGECWTWAGSVWHVGYGTIWRDGGMAYAHRVAYELQHGPILPGAYVLHRCDNRLCVRGDHLFIGTHLDNVADMLAKGRQAKGERLARAFTTEAVIDVRRRRAAGESSTALAQEYGVNQSHISRVSRGLAWKHV